MRKNISFFLFLFVLCIGCSSSDSNSESIDVNTQKLVSVFPGNGRFLVKYKITDAKIAQIKVECGTIKTATAAVSSNDLNKELEIYVGDNLSPIPEGEYNIRITALTKEGNHFASTEKSIRIFGDEYRKSLKQQNYSKTDYQAPTENEAEKLTVTWDKTTASEELGITLHYYDYEGNMKNRFIQKKYLSTSLILDHTDLRKPINYTTDYIPVTNAIDTLNSTITELIIDNAPWKDFYKDWEETEIQKGVVLRTHQYPTDGLWGRTQKISILEIAPDAEIRMDIVARKSLTKTTEMMEDNTIAAINGSYFTWNKPDEYNSKDYLRLNYVKVASDDIDTNRKNGCMFVTNKKIYFKPATSTTDWQDAYSGQYALGGGPLLLLDGKLRSIEVKDHNTLSHPRTFVGSRADGTIMLVTVDGRTNYADGMPCTELQRLAWTIGCHEALNFDGGGSTTMAVRENGTVKIVNHPSDGSEREVSNAILINPAN